MSIDLGHGVTVQVVPPDVPALRMGPPEPTTVTVLPVVGPQGPAGPAGAGYFRHEQATPTTVATVEHGFGRWPAAVTLTSLDGSVLYDEFGVQNLDLDTIRITTDTPAAYVALIS